MRKWRNDFNNTSNYDPGYDLFDDWDLIESSFAQQYNIRLRKQLTDMDWGEFSSYLAGLNGETALGNIVRIRKEKDPEVIKKFSPEERRIHNEWNRKQVVTMSEEDYNKAMANLEKIFLSMGKGGK